MLSPTSYIVGMGLGDKVALITDGRFSGGTAGACIGHLSPEAAEGWAIGLLRPGDRVRIDFPNRRTDTLLSEAELAERWKAWRPVRRQLTAWLARYRKPVTNASRGGVLEPGDASHFPAAELAVSVPPAFRGNRGTSFSPHRNPSDTGLDLQVRQRARHHPAVRLCTDFFGPSRDFS